MHFEMIVIVREWSLRHFDFDSPVKLSLPCNFFRKKKKMTYLVDFKIGPSLPFYFCTSVPSNEMALGHIRDEWINIKISFHDISLS